MNVLGWTMFGLVGTLDTAGMFVLGVAIAIGLWFRGSRRVGEAALGVQRRPASGMWQRPSRSRYPVQPSRRTRGRPSDDEFACTREDIAAARDEGPAPAYHVEDYLMTDLPDSTDDQAANASTADGETPDGDPELAALVDSTAGDAEPEAGVDATEPVVEATPAVADSTSPIAPTPPRMTRPPSMWCRSCPSRPP